MNAHYFYWPLWSIWFISRGCLFKKKKGFLIFLGAIEKEQWSDMEKMSWVMERLTYLFPMHPFSSPWKPQKTLRSSDIFRGKRKGALGTNGLIKYWLDNMKVLTQQTFVFVFRRRLQHVFKTSWSRQICSP